LSSGGDGEASVYRDRARRLGLPFAPVVRLGRGTAVDIEAVRQGTFAMSAEADRAAYVAPQEATIAKIADWLVTYRLARSRLSVATPAAIRSALIEAGAAGFVDNAIRRLARLHPHLSAAQVITTRQLAAGLVLAAGIGLAFQAVPTATLIAINLIGALFFFGVSVLRFVAAGLASGRRLVAQVFAPQEDDEVPVYTVLVPMFHEAGMVRELVAALDRIDWPRDRLDIKLIVEAADPVTAATARATADRAPYEVVVVPSLGPQTKPKALAFALPFARGEYVTVYDAEDRPHPRQLREAYAAFSRSAPDVACLQSPVVIDNREAGILARLFAVEYAALFDGLLPALAELGLPLPLGGTSNHFRRAALDAVGGWDPFNVTEDADIGLRLARFGYRVATLDLPTLEEAPAALVPWFRQRTRWFKGWMQTWLVHMRQPMRLVAELGWRGFLGFNLIATGIIVSALIHPVYLATLIAMATNPLRLWGDGGLFACSVIGVNLFNLFAGYLAASVLAMRALALRGQAAEARVLILLPVYWLLMSLASYRALLQLAMRPHHWEKTPHRGRGSGDRAAATVSLARAAEEPG
jgi:cellulose synthase/poly-beta-1,6-N-acetylglucosamine synthase-like glycosyltransferase